MAGCIFSHVLLSYSHKNQLLTDAGVCGPRENRTFRTNLFAYAAAQFLILLLVLHSTPARSARFLYFSAVFGLTILLTPPARAQVQPTSATPQVHTMVQLTGTVLSSTGQPLAGAAVGVEGKKLISASANSEGSFLLTLPAGEPVVLLVGFPAHEPQRVTIKNPLTEKNLVITLQSTGKQTSKALRARQKKYKRTGE